MSRRAALWPTLVAVCIFAISSGLPIVNLGLLIALIAVGVIGPRVQTDLLGEIAVVATTLTGAFLTVSSEVPESASWRGDQLEGGWVFLGLLGLYTSLARQLTTSPRGGDRATAGLNLLAVFACGSNEEFRLVVLGDDAARSAWPYLTMVMVYGWVQLHALKRLDPVWTRVPGVNKRTFIVLSSTLLLAAPAIWTIPLAHSALISYARDQWKASRTGFSEHTELGELKGMLMGSRVILRVQGSAPTYLRGLVYDRYISGRWVAPMRSGPPPSAWRSPTQGTTVIETISGARDRYFLPLNLASLAIPEGLASSDDAGIFSAPGRTAGRAEISLGTRAVAPLVPALDVDSDVPERIQSQLASWLQTEVGDLGKYSPRERIQAIAGRLMADYDYALEFSRDDAVDPIVDFLFRERRGHCEYFASAMTLLARQAGVPARMAVGYRVSEWNPIGQYHIVRERNAHAWTEVYYEDAWHTVDATAASSLPMPTETPVMGAIWDTARALTSRGLAALARLEWWAVTGMMLALLAVWGIVRWRRSQTNAASPLVAGYSDALPAYYMLDKQLRKRGVIRGPSEPMSDFIVRLERVFGPDTPVSAALTTYAAYRYGSVGAEESVSAGLKKANVWLRRRKAQPTST